MTTPPMALLAELTYRCPLRCGYCSNPTDWGRYTEELDTNTWRRVIREAAAAGVLHLHLSGGEPLLRHDLEDIARQGRDVGLFVNLITSAWSATPARLAALAHAGVEHVQISFQDSDPVLADRIAGTTAHTTKLDAAREVRALGMALSINVVLHRANLARVGALIDLAVSLGAQRIELANTQFHGSALTNQRVLLPTRAQLDEAMEVALAARARLQGVLDVLFVMPDWFTDTPRPCMDGWGKRFMTVAPDGTALPCPGAHGLQGMRLENVRDHDLAALWYRGADFERFRGTAWMPEPCASCERREIDYGGCRCQAFALTGDAAATDPTCVKAPRHDLVRRARDAHRHDEVLYRIDLTRRRRG